MRILLSDSTSLQIDETPFAMTVYRGDAPILRMLPINVAVSRSTETTEGVVLEFPDGKVVIRPANHSVSVSWESDLQMSNSFWLDGYWYGQGELINQIWPLNRAMIPSTPFETSDNGATGLSPILAPVWLSSQGVALRVFSLIEVSVNAPPENYPRHSWTLGPGHAPFSERPYLDPGSEGDGLLTFQGQNLEYEILFGDDAMDISRRLIGILGHLTETPPLEVLAKPIWNTWARYHAEISQSIVLNYAHEIVEHGYPCGRFVIDDRWQVCYGDLEFDPQRFPDPLAMIDELHGLGFSVHTWVVPFFAPESNAYQEGAKRGYLVHNAKGKPKVITWWQGLGGLLDVSNPDALAWFKANLQHLQAATGLDGFKFDAGEATYFPHDAATFEPMSGTEYTHHYIEFIGQHFPWSDVRAGWLNQQSPLLPRQWDKASTWGLDNGLHSVITGGLAMSLAGYALFLPDMIGGNAYVEQPDAELMIRWAQVNALMPGLQFSLAPWDYGPECEALCRKYAEMHESFGPLFHSLVVEHTLTGKPITRPIWWHSPHDEEALLCNDEFLLGDRYLAAPVVKLGLRSRDVYLPAGSWRDWREEVAYQGPLWLRDYPAPLDVLPLFEYV